MNTMPGFTADKSIDTESTYYYSISRRFTAQGNITSVSELARSEGGAIYPAQNVPTPIFDCILSCQTVCRDRPACFRRCLKEFC
jgi:hypothetical protein